MGAAVGALRLTGYAAGRKSQWPASISRTSASGSLTSVTIRFLFWAKRGRQDEGCGRESAAGSAGNQWAGASPCGHPMQGLKPPSHLPRASIYSRQQAHHLSTMTARASGVRKAGALGPMRMFCSRQRGGLG